jgi:small subunit ribosomal protein S8
MSMQDLLSDAIARMKNAQKAGHAYAILKHSKLVERVLNVLKQEGYIIDYSEIESDNQVVRLLKVDLKYYQGEPAIREIKRYSKSGRRVYSALSKLPKSFGGLGVLVLSTSKGVMSDYEARTTHVGGEVLCEVY